MAAIKTYGSQYRLLFELENNSNLLIKSIQGLNPNWTNQNIEFIAPKRFNDSKELRDGSFWREVNNINKNIQVQNFWVSPGPSWDLVAKLGDSTLLLFEAKAHKGELNSYCKANNNSQTKIKNIFDCIQSQSELNINNQNDWRKGYYQMANRIAHLYMIRKAGIDAHLINIYFNNEVHFSDYTKQNGDWDKSIEKQNEYLGISNHPISNYIHKLFID